MYKQPKLENFLKEVSKKHPGKLRIKHKTTFNVENSEQVYDSELPSFMISQIFSPNLKSKKEYPFTTPLEKIV